MSNTTKHKKTSSAAAAPAGFIGGPDYNDEHVYAGGLDGDLLVRTTAQSDGVSWLSQRVDPLIAVNLQTADDSATFIRVVLGHKGAVGHFNLCSGSAPNAGDATRDDHVLTFGYNTTPGGGRANNAEPCIEWRMEDYYYPGGGAGGPYIETHWQYYDATGAGFRPFAARIDRTNGGYIANSQVDFSATALNYIDITGVQRIKWTATQMLLMNSAIIQAAVNNYQCFQQMNAAGTQMLSLAYIDDSNLLRLGVGTQGCVANSSIRVGATGGMLSNFADQGLKLTRADNSGAYFVFHEQADPGVANADECKFYARDNGSGKTQFCVIFSSGSPIVLATQA
jgi:hypothetical protein